MEANTIRVERSYDPVTGLDGEPKSKGSKRTVPIIPTLRRYVIEQRMRTGGSGLVFPGRQAERIGITTLTRRAKTDWKRAGLKPIGLHECRHTFVSLMIAARCNIKQVSVYAGHGSVAFTLDRYGKLMPDDLQTTAKLLGDYIEAAV